MISIIGLGLVKSSILIMYKSIFSVRKFRIVVYCVLAYVVAWTVSFSFSHLFTCYPITVFIEPYYGNSCVETVPMFLALLVSQHLPSQNRQCQVPGRTASLSNTIKVPANRITVYGRNCRCRHLYSSHSHGTQRENADEKEGGCDRNVFIRCRVSIN